MVLKKTLVLLAVPGAFGAILKTIRASIMVALAKLEILGILEKLRRISRMFPWQPVLRVHLHMAPQTGRIVLDSHRPWHSRGAGVPS